jgi:hypothetical protein
VMPLRAHDDQVGLAFLGGLENDVFHIASSADPPPLECAGAVSRALRKAFLLADVEQRGGSSAAPEGLSDSDCAIYGKARSREAAYRNEDVLQVNASISRGYEARAVWGQQRQLGRLAGDRPATGQDPALTRAGGRER